MDLNFLFYFILFFYFIQDSILFLSNLYVYVYEASSWKFES